MIIIKHRVNSLKDVNPKFGIECDLWNYNGEAVLSHDSPNDDSVRLYNLLDANSSLYAINAKSNDLSIVLPALKLNETKDYFIFDASVPESIKLINNGYKVFTRQSEYERTPSFYIESSGVWMDQFKSDWIRSDHINQHLILDKKVAIVSPELHGRDHLPFWSHLKLMKLFGEVYLCTKYPEEAEEFFNGNI